MTNFIFYVIIFIIITNIVKSQQITNYYINSNANDNGNGTITNPFKSLCQLNSILNEPIIPIIINIEYGIYNSTNCTFFINNINNITIISYNNNNNNNNNNINNINNINNYQNSIIENININFNNSNIIINNLKFNFKNETILIIKSNLIFNGCILNLDLLDSAFIFYRIWDSNVNFINQSKFINRNQWEFNLQGSKLIVQDSLFDSILMMGGKGGNNINFDNSIFIDCYFNIISNSLMFVNNSEIIYNNNNHFNTFSTFAISSSNLTISNTLITSSSSKFGSPQIIYGDTINPITVSLYNITISNFIRSSLFSFSIGIIKFEKVKFIECTSSDFFYLSGWNNLYLDLNYINVLTNDYNHIFNLKNTNNNYLPINISNFKTSCSTIETFSKFISTTTVVSTSSPPHEKSTNLLVGNVSSSSSNNNNNNNYYHPMQINIRDSSLDCLGSMEFINFNVFFENVDIKASFEIFLIYGENSNFVLNSTSYITNDLKNDGFLFSLKSSTLFLNNSKFENSSSHFLSSIESHSKIEKTEFISGYSNLQNFFHLSDSSLDISTILIDNFNTPDSSLIHLLKSNLSISNSKISNSLFGKRPILFSQDSNCFIDNLIMTNCFCQIEFFQFSSNSGYYLFNSFISNSIITDNKGVGINQSPFIVASNVRLKINSCNFIRNLFLPLINSTKSFVTIQDVLYQNNSGSFHFSHYDYRINVTDFILKDNQIPLSFVFGIVNLAYDVSFNNIIISNNYLNQYFFFLSGMPQMSSTTEINNLIFTNNIVLNANDKFPFTLDSSIDGGGGGGVGDDFPISLFIFNQTLFSFSLSIFNNNTFNSGLITSFDSGITFSNCTINENLFSKSPNLLYSNSSQIIFQDCNVCSNYAKNQINSFSPSLIESSGLMNLTYSSLTINFCQFSNNSFPLSNGGIVYYYNNNSSSFSKKEVLIKKSNFSSNIANIGAVFYFSGDMGRYSFGYRIYYNEFYDNNGKTSGGAIYNQDKYFLDSDYLYSFNLFVNNFCKFGLNNISNEPNFIYFNYSTVGYSSENLIFEFYVFDILGELATQVFGTFNTSIVNNQSNPSFVTSIIYSGIGSFRNTFYSKNDTQYNITINIDGKPFISEIPVLGCLKFKYFIGDSMKCTYCPVGSTLAYKNGEKSCVGCDPNRLICQDKIFEALEGFYLINPNPNDVFECALDFCLKNNTCQPNQRNINDFCYYCSYDYERPLTKYSKVNSAKIGIQCCSKFEPFLLIPIFIIFIIFGLALSLFKYSMFSNGNILGPSIIFIQINSVVFFSYRISLLPLFRLSIDMFDGYCYFHNLNYLNKVTISYCSILVVAIIGFSDITINFIKINLWLLFYIKRKINPINDSNSIVIPKFIKTISNRNLKSNGNYKLNSYWSLFQVLFIPLFFNSISLLVSKEVDGNHFSALDFTIYYLNDNYLQIALFTLAIIIIVIISLFLIILFLNPIINNIINYYISRGSSNNSSSSGKSLKLNQPPYQNRIILKFNQFHQLILKLNYKNQFRWLELLVFLKTTIFISLSLSMIFNHKNYLFIIISVEILYQSFNFILLQTKNTKKLSRNYQNSIFQLIIFAIASSSLFSYLDSKTKGILITCFPFFIILIFIIIKIFNNLTKINKIK
ncbi:hypothetical protein ACTFIW_000075 [Dictyostelium discoideum]